MPGIIDVSNTALAQPNLSSQASSVGGFGGGSGGDFSSALDDARQRVTSTDASQSANAPPPADAPPTDANAAVQASAGTSTESATPSKPKAADDSTSGEATGAGEDGANGAAAAGKAAKHKARGTSASKGAAGKSLAGNRLARLNPADDAEAAQGEHDAIEKHASTDAPPAAEPATGPAKLVGHAKKPMDSASKSGTKDDDNDAAAVAASTIVNPQLAVKPVQASGDAASKEKPPTGTSPLANGASDSADSDDADGAAPNVAGGAGKAKASTDSGTAKVAVATNAAASAVAGAAAAAVQGASDGGAASGTATAAGFQQALDAAAAASKPAGAALPVPAQAPPEASFAATNTPTIINTIHTQLLPSGGAMSIHLEPPDLGPLQISVRMQHGVMSASFQTSSEQTTRLLTQSLSQLKTGLEAQGVSVERLHVERAPEDKQSSDGEGKGQGSSTQQDSSARQERQRKEMLQRMWKRVAIGTDDLDMVA
jgi:flagellar hook-length control protein FliK